MGKRNFDRPQHKRAGKQTEGVSGGDIPPEFRTRPCQAPRPKAEARREAEAALREFMKRQPAKLEPSLPLPGEKPPWED
jgi:hypothetical protein